MNHPTPTLTNNSSPYDALELTRDIVRDTRGVYALRVRGDGFIDTLINDGDIVVLRRVTSAENGDMVAVWIKPLEVTTLKRWFDEGERIRLQPDNRDLAPLYYHPDEVEVQGKAIAVVRSVTGKPESETADTRARARVERKTDLAQTALFGR